MSFNYTPPPAEISRMAGLALYGLYTALILVPRVRIGAVIGAIGLIAITGWEQSYAKGDMKALWFFSSPLYILVGALLGAAISLASRTIFRFVLRSLKTRPCIDECKEQDEESAGTTNSSPSN